MLVELSGVILDFGKLAMTVWGAANVLTLWNMWKNRSESQKSVPISIKSLA
jgi:hypothetical protein